MSTAELPITLEPSTQTEDATALLANVRAQLAEGNFPEAQRLARQAAKRFPDDDAVRRMNHALNERQARVRPSTGRDTATDFRWLQDPPPEARGKWVALAGGKVLALAAELKDLVEALSPDDHPQKPLLVHVD